MKANVLPNTLVLEGILDEESSVEGLEASLGALKKVGVVPPVNVDFSKVPYANSAGVVIWLKFAQKAGVSFKYVNAPVWLVSQFNMIKGYFDNGSFVESMHAPFFSPNTQESRVFTLQIGKDIPILNDFTNFNIPNRLVDGKDYEIDFSPERYLSFISENFQSFKEKIK